MESRIYNVNLQSGYNTLTYIGISQYDAGVPLQFNVYDGATAASFPAGTTAKIQGVRPSGVGFNIDCTLTDNVVTVDSSTDMTGEAGKFPVEIRFTASGVDVGTVNFVFLIEKAPHPDGTIDADITHEQEFIDRLEAIEEWIAQASGQGLSDAAKQALLQIAQKVVYIDEHGQDYYDALYDALYPPATLVSITAVYTQSGDVYDTDSLDVLRNDLVVTAHYDDSTSAVVTTYTLSGTLTEGTSTITASYGGKTATFAVTVSSSSNYLYNWDFTQSLVDSVQGSELTLSGSATRDSTGLHFTTANDYVELAGLNEIGNCFEIDIAEYDRQGASHGRLFTIMQAGVASSGFIYHNTGVWAIYSKAASAWVDSALGASALNGKTVTIKLLKNQEDKNWMYVLVDGEALIDGNMSSSTTTSAFLGSNNAQVAYNMTITGLRVYQEA